MTRMKGGQKRPTRDMEGSQMLEEGRKEIIRIFIIIHLSSTSIYKTFQKNHDSVTYGEQTLFLLRKLRFRERMYQWYPCLLFFICAVPSSQNALPHLSIYQIPIPTTKTSILCPLLHDISHIPKHRYNYTTLCIQFCYSHLLYNFCLDSCLPFQTMNPRKVSSFQFFFVCGPLRWGGKNPFIDYLVPEFQWEINKYHYKEIL